MRILVTGSRDWPDHIEVYRQLNAICSMHDLNFPPDEYSNTMPDPRKITVVHGHCPTGADYFADQWCFSNFLEPERHPADWAKYGKRAGFIRNKEMVYSGVDHCIAFIKDNSKGASMTARLAEQLGIPVTKVIL